MNCRGAEYAVTPGALRRGRRLLALTARAVPLDPAAAEVYLTRPWPRST